MTLISSIVSRTAGFIAASDIVLSRKSLHAPKVELPLREEGFSFSKKGRVLSGTAQKTSVFGRTLIQWTGSLKDCTTIIMSLFRHSQGGERYVNKEECFRVSGLSAAQTAELALIYHYIDHDEQVKSWEHNAKSEREGDGNLFYRGSGLAQYILKTEVIAPSNTVTPAVVVGKALSRAGAHLLKEVRSNAAYADWFGGWIEFAWRGQCSFEKVPCAVKLWRIDRDQNIIATDPYLFSYYVAHQLVIAKIEHASTGKQGQQVRRLIHVNDVLGRQAQDVLDPSNMKLDPYVTFHLILDDYKKEARSLQTFSYEAQGFSAKLDSENNVDLTWPSPFEDLLRGGSVPTWITKMRS